MIFLVGFPTKQLIFFSSRESVGIGRAEKIEGSRMKEKMGELLRTPSY